MLTDGVTCILLTVVTDRYKLRHIARISGTFAQTTVLPPLLSDILQKVPLHWINCFHFLAGPHITVQLWTNHFSSLRGGAQTENKLKQEILFQEETCPFDWLTPLLYFTIDVSHHSLPWPLTCCLVTIRTARLYRPVITVSQDSEAKVLTRGSILCYHQTSTLLFYFDKSYRLYCKTSPSSMIEKPNLQ